MPRQSQIIPIGRWLLLVVIILLLLEVFERRTGLISSKKLRLSAGVIRMWSKMASSEKRAKLVRFQKVPETSKVETETLAGRPASTGVPAPDGKTIAEKTPAPALLSALSKARRSAKARTDRKG